MGRWQVVVNTGTVTTHAVNVRARYHEEAEREALQVLGPTYADVVTLETRPL